MNAEQAVAVLSMITSQNGYAHFPSKVTTKPTDRVRAVYVQEDGDQIKVTVNADGRCLDRICEHITEKLGDGNVVITNKEPDDAPTEKTHGNRSKS